MFSATACSSGGPAAPQTGSLTVALTAPSGVTPNATVNGPNGYSTSLSATTTLTGLAVGSYAVTAATVAGADPIVSTIYTAVVSGSPASLTAGGQATVTGAYAAQPGTGGLWVGNLGTPSSVVEFGASQLSAGTSGAAATALGTTYTNCGMAFDTHGNLWASTYFTDTIVEFSANALAASGTPTPTVTIAVQPGHAPCGIAFDSLGNLWVANVNFGTIVQYTANQLASSGTPTPAVTITSVAGPFGLAFDKKGNLWVSDPGGAIVGLAASDLTTGGNITPMSLLTSSSNSLPGPLMIAFDPAGNLWVANGDSGNTLVEFTPNQLAVGGSPNANLTISATSGSLSSPAGLAFDASGDLWVSNHGNNTIVEYTANQLASSGSPVPNATVSGASLNGPLGIAFNPHDATLPIKPARRK